MNKHTKLALIIAPFLAIAGYGASDYYLTRMSNDEQLLKLELTGTCNLTASPCQLTADRISIELKHIENKTHLSTTFPLDLVTVSFADSAGTESIHHLIPDKFRVNWVAETDFTEYQTPNNEPITIRVGAIYSNLKYLIEFKTGL